MPEQDRKPSIILSQDSRDGVRCPICPGLIGASFQEDCVCCGRQVAASSAAHTTTQSEDLGKRVKSSLSIVKIGAEVPAPLQNHSASSQHVTRSVAQASQPVQNIAPACTSRASNGRQCRRRSIPHLLRGTYTSSDQRPGDGGTRDGVGFTTQNNIGSRSTGAAARMINQPAQQLPQHVIRPLRPRGGSCSSRGAMRGTNGGAHHVFKGVRTRENVKGFLVEIRPPKWKRTIWLGTYNTSIEAAGAYDAGVFYTKKPNAKYNLQSSFGAFPPLPSHLHLDRPDNMDEIKLFVQNQAREAARRAGNATITKTTNSCRCRPEAAVAASCSDSAAHDVNYSDRRLQEPGTSSESCITGDSAVTTHNGLMNDLSSMNSPSDYSQAAEIDSGFQIPLDVVYLGQCLHAEAAEEAATNMFLDYTNFWSQQAEDARTEQQLVSMSEQEEDEEGEDVEFTANCYRL